MNILLLSPWLPWPPFDGARIRIFHTLRYLSQRNRITLLASVRHPDEAEYASDLRGLCERITTTVLSNQPQSVLRRLAAGLLHGTPLVQSYHYDINLARYVEALTSEQAYDIIHVEFPFMAPYLAAISSQSRAKRVLSMHNVESTRFGRELKFSSWSGRRLVLLTDRLLFRSWEERSVCQFDGILTVSESEQAWVSRHAPGAQVEIIPNGADIDYFHASDPPGSSQALVFTGLMNHPPNVDAVVWFCDEVLPILHRKYPDLCFKIVGDKPATQVLALAKRRGVHVTGQVPDIRPCLSDCLALVVPLRSGGGTRLKILQGMAMQRPVISTRVGAEGLAVTPGVDILIGDTARDLADHVFSLLADPQLGERLGRAGRNLVETKYDWKICLSKLERFYETLLSASTLGQGPTDGRFPSRSSSRLEKQEAKVSLHEQWVPRGE